MPKYKGDTYILTPEQASYIQRVLSTHAALGDGGQEAEDIWACFARQFLRVAEDMPKATLMKLLFPNTALSVKRPKETHDYDASLDGEWVKDLKTYEPRSTNDRK